MTDLEIAKQILHANALAFVIVKEGVLLHIGKRDGIGELIATIDTLGTDARGAALADKIVGKAVAMVARYAGIRAVYSPLMSRAACDALAQAQVAFEFVQCVSLIMNKRNDDLCPLEKLTQSLDTPQAAMVALREFVRVRPAPPR